MRFLFFFFLFPSYLSAGFLSWFYTGPETVKEFDCPYDCGKPGSEGIKLVQWKGMHVFWELDQLAHEIREEDFPYGAFSYSIGDPWFNDVLSRGVCVSYTLEAPEIFGAQSGRHRWFDSAKVDKRRKFSHTWWPVERWKNGQFWGIVYDSCGGGYKAEVSDEYSSDLMYELESLRKIHMFSQSIQEFLSKELKETCNKYFPDLYRDATDVMTDQEAFNNILTAELKRTEIYLAEGKRYVHLGYGLPRIDREEVKIELINSLDRCEKRRQVGEDVRDKLEETRDRIDSALAIYGPRIQARLRDIHQTYCAIWDHCAAQHNAPAAYYNRALYHYNEGNNMNCIEDIKKLFEMTPSDMITDKMRENLLLRQGKAECELDLFDDAIFTLSKYISAFPRRKEAYLERAIAHFEMGNTSEALQDFINSEYEMYPIINSPGESMEYGIGVMKGLAVGTASAVQDNLSFAMSSLSGLSHGIIALASSPEETSKEFVRSCQEVIAVIKENGLPETVLAIFPEAKELFTNEPIHPSRQGELTGQLIGRFGIDILLLKGGVRAVRAARNFRKANATLTLERMSKSIQVEQQMVHHTQEWWNRTSKLIDELKTASSKDFGKSLYRTFRDTPLSESQVRKILHRAGYKTFPKPKGLPNDCVVSISEKGGGMIYRKAGTTAEQAVYVRVMPGDPYSPNVAQRSPYVIQRINNKAVTKNGYFVEPDALEIHISIEEYNFKGWHD